MSVFNPVEKSLCLHQLCEANYARLCRLVPDLARRERAAVATAQGKPALYLRVVERSPFTLVVELTHDFATGYEAGMEPAVRLRVCLDARTVEMLNDAARPRVHEALSGDPLPEAVLDYKWSLNYFLSRWLDHCLTSRYRFGSEVRETEARLASA